MTKWKTAISQEIFFQKLNFQIKISKIKKQKYKNKFKKLKDHTIP